MKNLQEKLDSFNVPCRVFERKSGIFTMENYAKRDKIRINKPKGLNVKVFGKKSARQAVLVFSEPPFVDHENVYIYSRKIADLGNVDKDNKELLEAVEIRRRYVLGSSFEVESVNREALSSCTICRIKVTAPERENCFLIGVDEKNTFICQLPKVVKSVSAAHEALRPDVSENAIRSGEWFFDPLTDEKEIAKVIEYGFCQNTNYESCWDCASSTVDESCYDERLIDYSEIYSDNHVASMVSSLYDEVYVMGFISDTRKTHKSIYLPGPHKVRRNMELINDSDKWD